MADEADTEASSVAPVPESPPENPCGGGAAPADVPPEALAPAEPTGPTPGETCYGRVKSYNHGKGFGFLECPAVAAKFGRDVFLRKAAVADEHFLDRIASGSGPGAAVQRGELFARFTLVVNDAGNPEASEVVEVKRTEVPAEALEQLAAPKAKASTEAKAKPSAETEAKAKPSAETKVEAKAKAKAKGGSEPDVGLEHNVRVGRNAQENWALLRGAKSRHWFFHLTDHPSAYVILECNKEPSEKEKRRCAEICRDHSKQKLSGTIQVDATCCGNVSFGRKGDEVGECVYKKEALVEVITLT